MKAQSTTEPKSQINPATVHFVKDLCLRISQALDQIDGICTEQLEPKPEPSPLGYFQGIGLFSYVKSNQAQLREKYPAFTDNQILSILLVKWQRLTNDEKLQFCSKFNLNKLVQNKKLRKLNKKGQKILQNILNIQQQDSTPKPKFLQNYIKQSPTISTPETQRKQSAEVEVEAEGDLDRFFDQSPGEKKKLDFQLEEIGEKESQGASVSNMAVSLERPSERLQGECQKVQIDEQEKQNVEVKDITVQAQQPLVTENVASQEQEIGSCQINQSVVPVPSVNQQESFSFMPSIQSAQDSEKSQKLLQADSKKLEPESQKEEAEDRNIAENSHEISEITFGKSEQTPFFQTSQLIPLTQPNLTNQIFASVSPSVDNEER